MYETEKCQFTRNYSELAGLQKERTLTYLVAAQAGGVIFSLRREDRMKVCRESCFIPQISFARARDIAILMMENSVSETVWKDLLEELGIQYTMLESTQNQFEQTA